MQGSVLTIAGSDPSGGAGIQADIKTITILGGYASSAITALTAQNSTKFYGIKGASANFVYQQIEAVLTNITVDVIKTGMLLNGNIIEAIVAAKKQFSPEIPLIIDPVMVSTSGTELLSINGINILKKKLIPQAVLITPNVPEAEILSGFIIKCTADMELAAKKIKSLYGAKAILITGGHLEGDFDYIEDLLLAPDNRVKIFKNQRIKGKKTHGTGCTLTSAIATYVAQKYPLSEAIEKAISHVSWAILNRF